MADHKTRIIGNVKKYIKYWFRQSSLKLRYKNKFFKKKSHMIFNIRPMLKFSHVGKYLSCWETYKLYMVQLLPVFLLVSLNFINEGISVLIGKLLTSYLLHYQCNILFCWGIYILLTKRTHNLKSIGRNSKRNILY